MKDEMGFLLLSSIAEIEDLRRKVKEGSTPGGYWAQGMTGGVARSGASTAAQATRYLKVASAGANFTNAISDSGGGGARSG